MEASAIASYNVGLVNRQKVVSQNPGNGAAPNSAAWIGTISKILGFKTAIYTGRYECRFLTVWMTL